jgi:hypothetical protein
LPIDRFRAKGDGPFCGRPRPLEFLVPISGSKKGAARSSGKLMLKWVTCCLIPLHPNDILSPYPLLPLFLAGGPQYLGYSARRR